MLSRIGQKKKNTKWSQSYVVYKETKQEKKSKIPDFADLKLPYGEQGRGGSLKSKEGSMNRGWWRDIDILVIELM